MTTLYKIGGITDKTSDNITTNTGNVKLGTDSLVPVRLPNFNNAERTAITPGNGALVYNTTDNKIYARQSGAWSEVGTGGSGDFIQVSTASLAGSSSVNLSVPVTTNGMYKIVISGLTIPSAAGVPSLRFDANTTGYGSCVLSTSIANDQQNIPSQTQINLNSTAVTLNAADEYSGEVTVTHGMNYATTPAMSGRMFVQTMVCGNLGTCRPTAVTPNTITVGGYIPLTNVDIKSLSTIILRTTDSSNFGAGTATVYYLAMGSTINVAAGHLINCTGTDGGVQNGYAQGLMSLMNSNVVRGWGYWTGGGAGASFASLNLCAVEVPSANTATYVWQHYNGASQTVAGTAVLINPTGGTPSSATIYNSGFTVTTGSNITTRFTNNSGSTKIFFVSFSISWLQTAGDEFDLYLYKNGSFYSQQRAAINTGQDAGRYIRVAVLVSLDNTDYVEPWCECPDGSNTVTFQEGSFFAVEVPNTNYAWQRNTYTAASSVTSGNYPTFVNADVAGGWSLGAQISNGFTATNENEITYTGTTKKFLVTCVISFVPGGGGTHEPVLTLAKNGTDISNLLVFAGSPATANWYMHLSISAIVELANTDNISVRIATVGSNKDYGIRHMDLMAYDIDSIDRVDQRNRYITAVPSYPHSQTWNSGANRSQAINTTTGPEAITSSGFSSGFSDSATQNTLVYTGSTKNFFVTHTMCYVSGSNQQWNVLLSNNDT